MAKPVCSFSPVGPGHGFCNAVGVLVQFFGKDAMLNGDTNSHTQNTEMLREIEGGFVNWLGETMYMSGLTTIPPSRFTNKNSNGLWEYLPFLGGIGLMEELELVYEFSHFLWDRIPEPMLVIHLHNMLVQKGYIETPIGLYYSLQQLF